MKVKGEGKIKIFSDDFFRIYNHFEMHLNNNLIDTDKNENYSIY